MAVVVVAVVGMVQQLRKERACLHCQRLSCHVSVVAVGHLRYRRRMSAALRRLQRLRWR
jgi:hypothetical protein